MKNKVFVAFSGGVDSSIAALLLKDEGYDVTAVYMKNWSGESLGIDDNCPWQEDMEYVEKVCKQLDIPYITYNFEKEYKQLVIEDFYAEYRRGNTPNPDLLCNKFIKFDAFLNKALQDGADMIATGHYAITQDGRLYKGLDPNKDQTYFLAGLSNSQLEKSLFPIGKLQKHEVRKIAKNHKLANANRKDSQGICFVGKVDVREFISLRLKEKEGDIVDLDSGEIVGKHRGVWFYTEGQRKGLQIGGLDNPYFVARKDPKDNLLYVAKGKKNPLLWKKQIEIEDLHNISEKRDIRKSTDLKAVIRYRGKTSKVSFDDSDKSYLNFHDAQWAPAPGQSVVFFKDNECLGLAKIA